MPKNLEKIHSGGAAPTSVLGRLGAPGSTWQCSGRDSYTTEDAASRLRLRGAYRRSALSTREASAADCTYGLGVNLGSRALAPDRRSSASVCSFASGNRTGGSQLP